MQNNFFCPYTPIMLETRQKSRCKKVVIFLSKLFRISYRQCILDKFFGEVRGFMSKNLSDVFGNYRYNYHRIFSLLYPSKNSTGFTERNLSVNFAHAYEQVNSSAITWFEFQFGEHNNLHYYAIIIDPENKRLLLIESKRFSKPSKKISGIATDIDRIQRAKSSYLHDFKLRIPDILNYQILGVILADVWTETRTKKQIYDSFVAGTFIPNFLSDLLIKYPSLHNINYYIGDFDNLPYDAPKRDVLQTYHLVSFTWEL